jgi:hypothetical protein
VKEIEVKTQPVIEAARKGMDSDEKLRRELKGLNKIVET